MRSDSISERINPLEWRLFRLEVDIATTGRMEQ